MSEQSVKEQSRSRVETPLMQPLACAVSQQPSSLRSVSHLGRADEPPCRRKRDQHEQKRLINDLVVAAEGSQGSSSERLRLT